MAEYIKKETALEIVKRTQGDYAAAFSEIAHLPADDVVELRRGRWVNTNKEVEQICKCSECGYPISYFWSRTPYCPNCGARMDKEGEHEIG